MLAAVAILPICRCCHGPAELAGRLTSAGVRHAPVLRVRHAIAGRQLSLRQRRTLAVERLPAVWLQARGRHRRGSVAARARVGSRSVLSASRLAVFWLAEQRVLLLRRAQRRSAAARLARRESRSGRHSVRWPAVRWQTAEVRCARRGAVCREAGRGHAVAPQFRRTGVGLTEVVLAMLGPAELVLAMLGPAELVVAMLGPAELGLLAELGVAGLVLTMLTATQPILARAAAARAIQGLTAGLAE